MIWVGIVVGVACPGRKLEPVAWGGALKTRCEAGR
jgi:hypothetical protein